MTRSWKVGDRVVWPHHEKHGGRYEIVRSVGTITAVNEPGLPRGVRVTFDELVNGAPSCYATYGELERA